MAQRTIIKPTIETITDLNQIKHSKPWHIHTLENIVILQRHWPHTANVSRRRYIRLARKIGAMMDYLPLACAMSSPEPRAIEAALAFQNKHTKRVPIRTDDRLGALSGADPELLAQIKAGAKSLGVTPETFILESVELTDLRKQRGNEGAEAVLEMVDGHMGKTFLVTSHGGSRLELTIAALVGRDQCGYPCQMPEGAICFLSFDDKQNINFEHYLVFDNRLLR
ncbi:histidine phosphatase family protein [Patescibacteria group bacterium]|nr:histidine phosphatase family protein [Patescibacteria group bacterium]